jgi:hypothetical protein
VNSGEPEGRLGGGGSRFHGAEIVRGGVPWQDLVNALWLVDRIRKDSNYRARCMA